MRAYFVILSLFTTLALHGCNKTIPNTTVRDDPQNREIVSFMEKYRAAVTDRDIAILLKMAHRQYLDDNGTPIGDDDIDYSGLEEKLIRWKERVKDVRYEIKYLKVSSENHRILVAFRYTASFRLTQSDGDPKWSRRVGDHRVVLERDPKQHSYLFLSGM